MILKGYINYLGQSLLLQVLFKYTEFRDLTCQQVFFSRTHVFLCSQTELECLETVVNFGEIY
jgi:hypothetical protein